MIQKSNKRSTEERSDEESDRKNDVKVKKEKLDDRVLHPMSFYADDRLELVKQMFSTLKPKTIRNLAPEHIRDEGMEVIEESVLNELLCMSTKRLRAIINATRCPSDTESGEDSDVEHEEQHVSLEEISSDSDIDGPGKQAKHKYKTKKVKKQPQLNATSSTENGSNSQISILELLELQARARAIRSQLALEPVTKIEVASDEDINTATISEPKNNSAVTNSVQTNVVVNGNISPHNSAVDGETSARPKLRLQRRYRQKSTIQTTKSDDEKELPIDTKEKVKGSQSPDVIPIVAETETLVINDSSDEESTNLQKMKVDSSRNEKKVEAQKEMKEAEIQTKERSLSEAEEGEIRDEEEEQKKAEAEQNEANRLEQNMAAEAEEKNKEDEETSLSTDEKAETAAVETTTNETEHGKEEETSVTGTEIALDNLDSSGSPKKDLKVIDAGSREDVIEQAADTKVLYESDEDDIISLEGGDLEMIDLDEGTNQSTAASATSCTKFEYDDDDVIALDSSEGESTKTETPAIGSWSDRYMKSTKVSKVLTVSRLNRKVRDKLKAKNRESKAASAEMAIKEAALRRNELKKKAFTSKHADGTIEQYKELLDIEKKLKRIQQAK